jgi:hypothetical protein
MGGVIQNPFKPKPSVPVLAPAPAPSPDPSPALPPPRILPVVIPPTTPEVSQGSATDMDYRGIKRRRRGRSLTILTGSAGVQEGATLGTPTLLG